jgi:hypothetical protein
MAAYGIEWFAMGAYDQYQWLQGQVHSAQQSIDALIQARKIKNIMPGL